MKRKQDILKSHADWCSRRAALTIDPLVRDKFFHLAAQWLELAAMPQEREGRRHEASIGPVPSVRNGPAGWGAGQGAWHPHAHRDGCYSTRLRSPKPSTSLNRRAIHR